MPNLFGLKFLFKRTPRKRFFFFLAADVLLISLSVYLSFWLRFDFHIPARYIILLPSYLLLILVLLIPNLFFFGLYYFTWTYISVSDLLKLFKASGAGFLQLTAILFLGRNIDFIKQFPRSIIIIDFFIVFFLLGGLRLSKRLLLEFTLKKNSRPGIKPKIMIIGAGDAAEQLIRSIKQTPHYPFHIVGILDDNALKQKTNIHDIRVLGSLKALPRYKKLYNLSGIIIALPRLSTEKVKAIIKTAQDCNISYIKMLPPITELIDERVSLRDVRDIGVEDLLGREIVDISHKEIKEMIRDKSILITGAAGSIGFELVKQIAKLEPRHLIALDMDETGIFKVDNYLSQLSLRCPYQAIVANIINKPKLTEIFSCWRPQIIFHAAAYKHVKIMEQYPEEAVINNILGTWNLAETAVKYQAQKFILISTDKAVKPTSVMGMTKRVAELLINYHNRDTKFFSVRFGNVLGSRGSVVPLFKKQIRSGGPVTVTHPDMKRYFMAPSEAILLVLQAAAIGQGGEIFVLDMGQPVKILDLAETMIKLAGLEPNRDIPIVFTHPEPGEKLFEEILTDQENMGVTKNKKIFIALHTSAIDKENFFQEINRLIAMAKTGQQAELKTGLLKITSAAE